LLSGARCYKPGTRVVVFVQGIYSTYDASGTQSTLVESQRFNTLKAAFVAKGYQRNALIDFSYAGGSVRFDGAWQPAPYGCALTDRPADQNLAVLEQTLRGYRARHPDVHFTLVGHSLGGYLAFLEGAREAGRDDASKLGIDVVVTLDAPLEGVSVDKKTIIDLIPCDKTYVAGAEIVAEKFDPAITQTRAAQAAAMAAQGIRLATMGNEWDCLWNTGHCLPGGGWVDDGETQFVGGAAFTGRYHVDASPLLSHDAILADSTVATDTTNFVGAP
jgi:pimeloyl-ACP methyl ester carboxylesterase